MKKKAADIVIENAAQILTCEKDAADHIGLIKNGSVAIGEGKITAVGSRSEIAPLIDAATRVIDASGKVVSSTVTPMWYSGERAWRSIAPGWRQTTLTS